MLNIFQKLFKKKQIPTPTRLYKNGFYVDINTIEEKSKSVWSEWIMTPDGIEPIFPNDRTEIH